MMYFLDTSTIVPMLRNRNDQNIRMKLESYSRKDVKIPAIAKAELLAGAYMSTKKEFNLERVERILSFFDIVPFDDLAAVVYGKIQVDLEKKGKRIGYNDLLIAATTISRGGVLVTNNVGEFGRVKGLQIEDWLG